MYFYNVGDIQIVGALPKILVRNEQTASPKIGSGESKRKVTIRQFDGTRLRDPTPEQDE